MLEGLGSVFGGRKEEAVLGELASRVFSDACKLSLVDIISVQFLAVAVHSEVTDDVTYIEGRSPRVKQNSVTVFVDLDRLSLGIKLALARAGTFWPAAEGLVGNHVIADAAEAQLLCCKRLTACWLSRRV